MRKRTPTARPKKTFNESEGVYIPSEEEIQENIAAGTFFRVDRPEGGKISLSIRGAKSMWGTRPNFVYVPGINIAGELPRVEQALLIMANGDENEVRNSLQGAITSDNYNVPVAEGGQQEVYEAIFEEFARKQEHLKHDLREGYTASGVPFVTLDMLPYILANIKTEKKTGIAPSRRVARSNRAAPSRRVKSLWDRIQRLPGGKVLDVSKLTPEGTGAITINTPGPISPKIGDVSIPIVSNNLEAYALALRMISEETGVDYTQLAGNWEELFANRGRRKSPVRRGGKRVTPPSGKVLAPPQEKAPVRRIPTRVSPTERVTTHVSPSRKLPNIFPTRRVLPPLTRVSPTRQLPSPPLTRVSPTRQPPSPPPTRVSPTRYFPANIPETEIPEEIRSPTRIGRRSAIHPRGSILSKLNLNELPEEGEGEEEGEEVERF